MATVRALFDQDTVCVFQAFCPQIADFSARHGRLGGGFKFTRTSWIKTSFLWIMHRSAWATKPNQERILAIYIHRSAFDFLLENAVLSSHNKQIYPKYNDWRDRLAASDVRVQWDPDRDVFGNPNGERAVQLGLRGAALRAYATQYIHHIEDVTDYVRQTHARVLAGAAVQLPQEDEYPTPCHG